MERVRLNRLENEYYSHDKVQFSKTRLSIRAKITCTDRNGYHLDSLYIGADDRKTFAKLEGRAWQEFWDRHGKKEVYVFTNSVSSNTTST